MKKRLHIHSIHPVFRQKLTIGQKTADVFTCFCGTWTFIFLILFFIFVWISLNMIAFLYHWDPWPFIILNLILSCLAALQAPIILMSQNRQTERDRIHVGYDYAVNRKAEREIEEVKVELGKIKQLIISLKK